MAEVTFRIELVCDVSDIEGHGLEREIELVKQGLHDGWFKGIEAYAQTQRVDHVDVICIRRNNDKQNER